MAKGKYNLVYYNRRCRLTIVSDVFSAPRSAPNFQMPPPPLLDHASNIARDEPVVVGEAPVKGKGKKDKKVTVAEDPASTDEAPPGPAPKRRGRPPGSKNKPKTISAGVA